MQTPFHCQLTSRRCPAGPRTRAIESDLPSKFQRIQFSHTSIIRLVMIVDVFWLHDSQYLIVRQIGKNNRAINGQCHKQPILNRAANNNGKNNLYVFFICWVIFMEICLIIIIRLKALGNYSYQYWSNHFSILLCEGPKIFIFMILGFLDVSRPPKTNTICLRRHQDT